MPIINPLTGDTKSPYQFLLSDLSYKKIESYLIDLQTKNQTPGAYLEKQLDAFDLSTIDMASFIDALIQTKKDRIFAESTQYGGDLNWNETELSLLGDISCAVNVKVFDNGSWKTPKVYPKPFDATLLFVPGALLKHDWSPDIKPDFDEVVKDGQFNFNAFYKLYKRRLLPGLLHVNNQVAEEKGKKLMITIPGMGCGQFAGLFKDTPQGKGGIPGFPEDSAESFIHNQFQKVMERLLLKQGQKLQNIGAIWYDNFNKTASTQSINGIDFLARPLSKGGKPQLCMPQEYGSKYANYHLVSFVAWDHVSLPGNDYWDGMRDTDDGVKAAATSSMSVLTGLDGYYDAAKHLYLCAAAPSKSWSRIKQKHQIKIDSIGKTTVYPLKAAVKDLVCQKINEETKPCLAAFQYSAGAINLVFEDVKIAALFGKVLPAQFDFASYEAGKVVTLAPSQGRGSNGVYRAEDSSLAIHFEDQASLVCFNMLVDLIGPFAYQNDLNSETIYLLTESFDGVNCNELFAVELLSGMQKKSVETAAHFSAFFSHSQKTPADKKDDDDQNCLIM